ncbi:MAG: hypothetical protein JRN20_19910 [Nitrososphaerota archaeon]|nr:hypothetical protein [Nitrososphaerota archaeon]
MAGRTRRRCELCEREFSSDQGLLRHYADNHPDARPPEDALRREAKRVRENRTRPNGHGAGRRNSKKILIITAIVIVIIILASTTAFYFFSTSSHGNQDSGSSNNPIPSTTTDNGIVMLPD